MISQLVPLLGMVMPGYEISISHWCTTSERSSRLFEGQCYYTLALCTSPCVTTMSLRSLPGSCYLDVILDSVIVSSSIVVIAVYPPHQSSAYCACNLRYISKSYRKESLSLTWAKKQHREVRQPRTSIVRVIAIMRQMTVKL